MRITWCQLPILIALVVGCATTDTVAPKLVEVETERQVDDSKLSRTVTGIINAERIEATTRYRRFQPYDRKRHEHWLGADGGYPDYVVSSMTVTRDGRNIEIPYELYSDFGDFSLQGRFLRLLQADGDFAVKHSGSDGAGSYNATFFFDGDGLDRVVVSTLGLVDHGMVGRVQHTRKPTAEQAHGEQRVTRPEFE